MPLPTPKKDEEESNFISRCMSNDTMKDEFPDQKKRNAVCYRQWKENKNSKDKMMKKEGCINFVSKHYEVEKEEGNKERYIEVPISGLDEDRDGEKMSEEAINKMISALKKGVMLHSNHGQSESGSQYSWKDITGVSVDGWREDNLLVAKFRLNKAHPDHELMWNYVHNEKMPVGFSIGARPIKTHFEEVEEKENE